MKKIDSFFKKNLDVPQPPPSDAWEYIQKHIDSKKPKTVIPFWIRFSGIAASLLLMVGLGYYLGKENSRIENSPSNPIVTSPNSNSNELQQSRSNSSESTSGQNNSQIESVTNQSNPDSQDFYQINSFTKGNQQKSGSINSYSREVQSYKKETNALLTNLVELISYDLPVRQANFKGITSLELGKFPFENKFINSTFDEHENLTSNQPKNKKSTAKKNKIDFDRFYIAGYASPMAFNSFVGGSMLSDEMNDFKTENNVTLAYGIKAGYSLTPKLKIRTGVSMIGFEQLTSNVPLAGNITGRPGLPAVDEVNNVYYKGNLRIDNTLSQAYTNSEIMNKMGTGDIQQQTSYVEIPLEAEVSLFQTNSIGISATGGASTLVLSKNKIFVHTNDYTEELGRANNLNNLSFTANAGLKFDMNVSEKVKVNVEPNFKYLINPVNDIKKYNPYTIGVNAGISVSLK